MLKFFWDYSDTIFPFATLTLLLFTNEGIIRRYSLLVLYLFLTTGIMGYSNYLADRSINNVYLYHLYSLIELAILLPMIAGFSQTHRRNIIACITTYLAFWTINLLQFEPFDKFNSNSASIAALFIIYFCFRYYLHLIKTDGILFFQKDPDFWITSGFFFFFVGSIYVTGSYKYCEWFNENIITKSHWKIQQAANIIKYILISIGIICSYRRPIMGGS